jgi:vacuolar-type H+-ATPase subunit H
MSSPPDLDTGLLHLRSAWNTTNKLSMQAQRRCHVSATSVVSHSVNKTTSGINKRMEFLNQFPPSKVTKSEETSDVQNALLLAQRSGGTLDQIVGNLHSQLNHNMRLETVTASNTRNRVTPQKLHFGGVGRGKIRTQGVRVLLNTITKCRDVSKPVLIPTHLAVPYDQLDGVWTDRYHAAVEKAKEVASAAAKKMKEVADDVKTKAKEAANGAAKKILKKTETPTDDKPDDKPDDEPTTTKVALRDMSRTVAPKHQSELLTDIEAIIHRMESQQKKYMEPSDKVMGIYDPLTKFAQKAHLLEISLGSNTPFQDVYEDVGDLNSKTKDLLDRINGPNKHKWTADNTVDYFTRVLAIGTAVKYMMSSSEYKRMMSSTDADDALTDTKKNADAVAATAKFTRLQLSSTQYLHHNTPLAVGCRRVNVMDVCNDIPISYSAGFELSSDLVKNVNTAVKFAQDDMGLHVHKVDMLVGDKHRVVSNNCISDSVVFTPRKVGGPMLYTQSLFTHSDDTRALTKKNEPIHILDSVPNESRHVVYGVNMPDVLDSMTTRVSDCVQKCADKWVHTMCENDKSKVEAMHQNGHMPTIQLVTTAHSTHTCPVRGVSVHVQHNNFRCMAPAIGRYTNNECKTLDLQISSVALFFHGPLVDVHV